MDDDGRIGACIAEPEARADDAGHTSTTWDEDAFRAAVEAEVATWEARDLGECLWIQFDPGRDWATSIKVELKG